MKREHFQKNFGYDVFKGSNFAYKSILNALV